MKRLSLTVLVICALCFWHSRGYADSKIYVIRHADGSTTFTSRPPKEGQSATLFAPKKLGFSSYSVRAVRRYSSNKLYPNEYKELIESASARTGVDVHLIRAVIHAESGFNPRARSPKGAMGLMQLMPGTADLVGVKNAYEPRQNILGGSRYLALMLERFQGDVKKAIAAYNAGPENVMNYGGIPPFAETREYVRRVTALHQAYKRG